MQLESPPSAEFFVLPELCPACSGPVAERGDFLYCEGRACPAKLSGAVLVWVRNFGLLHIGDSTIAALTDPEAPVITSVADLYRLSVEDWEKCCSGPKMAEKCYTSLHSNKDVPLELVLSSLNIPNFGLSTATDIVQAGFDTVEKVLGAGFDELTAVHNVGERTARQIQEGLVMRRDLLLDLAGLLSIRKPSGGPLAGQVVCITGELSRPRKLIERAIMDAGGTTKGTVSKTTAYLVTNDPNTSSSKMQAAKRHGVKVISEAELYAILGTS